MSRTVLGWLAVLFLVMGLTGIWFGVRYAGARNDGLSGLGSAREVDPTYLKPPANVPASWLKDFSLVDQSGKQVATADLRGQVYVTNFFFSSCPGTCLQQNQKIREIAEVYGPRGVTFLSITCDPEIDSPERLREYGTKLKADFRHWRFLTGSMTYLQRVAAEIYNIPLDKGTHSERFFVTDKWGNLRGMFAWNKLNEITDMKVLLDKLLAEEMPPPELRKIETKEAGSEDPGAGSQEPSAGRQEPSAGSHVPGGGNQEPGA
jgi:protein SCO1/2